MDQLETEKRTLQLRMDPCEDPQLVPSAIQPCPPSVPLGKQTTDLVNLWPDLTNFFIYL